MELFLYFCFERHAAQCGVGSMTEIYLLIGISGWSDCVFVCEYETLIA